MMLVSLFTARIILRIIGVEDYGIYSVVAGFVSTFTFITGTISAATSRFFAFELGKRNYVKLNQYFRLSILCFVGIGIIILIIAETIGLWFVCNKMIIPVERISAAFWVYQCSVLSFIINMFAIPYHSVIIAREKMNVYAYIGIIEAILKLLIVYILLLSNVDKLKLYAVLTLCVTVTVMLSYYFYCKRKYEECCFSFFWDGSMFREFFAYSFWIVFGTFSGVCRGQGLNILLNLFFGPVINAAYGLSNQVHSVLNQFVNSFYTACRPQITKRYAMGEMRSMMQLVYTSSRMCYFLVLIFAVPLLVEMPFLLNLWLTEVPSNTILFARLVVIITLIDSSSYPLQAAVMATGRVKWYQIITGGLMISTLGIAYVFLKLGYQAEVVFYVSIVTAGLAQLSRIVFMRILLNMFVIEYIKKVLLKIGIVTTAVIIAIGIVYELFNSLPSIAMLIIYFILVVSLIFFLGITRDERVYIRKLIKL